jgi:cullin-4
VLPVFQKRLSEEYDRCVNYLDPATRKPLVAATERQLLERHMAAIIDKGFAAMLDGQRLGDLKRLYALCARVAALDALKVGPTRCPLCSCPSCNCVHN